MNSLKYFPTVKLVPILLLFMFNCPVFSQTTHTWAEFKKITSHLNNFEAASIVIIPTDMKVIMDSSIDVKHLWIRGTLQCDNQVTPNGIIIRTQGVLVMGPQARLICGEEHAPFVRQIKFELHGQSEITDSIPIHSHMHSHMNSKMSMGVKAMAAMHGGEIHFHGDLARNPQPFTSLAAPLLKGVKNIVVKDASGWSKGDQIVIASTSYRSAEAEIRTIEAIRPNSLLSGNSSAEITLNSAVKYNHMGGHLERHHSKTQNWRFSKDAEVAKVNRNIVIEGSDSFFIPNHPSEVNGVGGHIMIMSGGKAFISGVMLLKMGQMGKMGRYPFHWHILRDEGMGQYFKNSTIVSSFQRCLVIHRTNGTLVSHNLCYDHFGHGFFLEDGEETQNIITKNIVMGSKQMPKEKALLQSEYLSPSMAGGFERFPPPASFWISNPMNDIRDNVAAGSVGTGFWMSFSQGIHCDKDGEKSCIEANQNVTMRPAQLKTLRFDSNVAHSNIVSFTWDGAPKLDAPAISPINALNPNDLKIGLSPYLHTSLTNPSNSYMPVFSNLSAYTSHTGIYFRGATARFDQAILADNHVSVFFAYNQMVTNSLIIGASQGFVKEDYVSLQRKDPIQGVRLYDGPFDLRNVHFVGFPETNEFYYTLGEEKINYTPTVFFAITGANKFQNVVSGLSFDGNPYYLFRTNQKTDAQYCSVIRDVDGSLSGMPDSLVLSKHPLTFVQNQCENLDRGGEAIKCHSSLKTGFFDFWPEKPTGGRSFSSLRKDTVHGTEVFNPRKSNANESKLALWMDKTNPSRFQYQLTDFFHASQPVDLSHTVMMFFTDTETQSSSLISVPLDKKYQTCHAYVIQSGVPIYYPETASLKQLQSEVEHGFFFDGQSLHIKLLSKYPRVGSFSGNGSVYWSDRVHLACRI